MMAVDTMRPCRRCRSLCHWGRSELWLLMVVVVMVVMMMTGRGSGGDGGIGSGGGGARGNKVLVGQARVETGVSQLLPNESGGLDCCSCSSCVHSVNMTRRAARHSSWNGTFGIVLPLNSSSLSCLTLPLLL